MLNMANPFSFRISGYRDAVLYGNWVPITERRLIVIEAIAALWGGFRILQHLDRRVIRLL